MPSATTAEITTPIAFPDEPGEPIWIEERRVPVATLFGVPLVFTVVAAVVVDPLVGKAVLAAAAVALGGLLLRARRSALIETFALSESWLTVEQRRGGRVALPVSALTDVTVTGDRVRLESSVGVLTLGFVGRQRAFVRALEQVAPTARFDRDVTAFCPT